VLFSVGAFVTLRVSSWHCGVSPFIGVTNSKSDCEVRVEVPHVSRSATSLVDEFVE